MTLTSPSKYMMSFRHFEQLLKVPFGTQTRANKCTISCILSLHMSYTVRYMIQQTIWFEVELFLFHSLRYKCARHLLANHLLRTCVIVIHVATRLVSLQIWPFFIINHSLLNSCRPSEKSRFSAQMNALVDASVLPFLI